MNMRKLIIPAAGLLIFGFVLLSRDRTPSSARPSRSHPPRPTRHSAALGEKALPSAPPALRQSSSETIQRASEDARIRSTYENYRSAVVLENPGLQQALRPVLIRDRAASLKLAQEEYQRASTHEDRQVAQTIMSALGGTKP